MELKTGINRTSIAAICIVLSSCSKQAEQSPSPAPQTPKTNSTVTQPIFLKDLTTGINLKDKAIKSPKQLTSSGLHSFKHNLFNTEQFVRASTTKDQRIYEFEIQIEANKFNEAKEAFESKLSKNENKTIEFNCRTEERNEEFPVPHTTERTECTIQNEIQTLELSKKTPKSNKPTAIPMDLWLTLSSAKIQLIDHDLARLASAEKNSDKDAKEQQEKINATKRKADI